MVVGVGELGSRLGTDRGMELWLVVVIDVKDGALFDQCISILHTVDVKSSML